MGVGEEEEGDQVIIEARTVRNMELDTQKQILIYAMEGPISHYIHTIFLLDIFMQLDITLFYITKFIMMAMDIISIMLSMPITKHHQTIQIMQI